MRGVEVEAAVLSRERTGEETLRLQLAECLFGVYEVG